MKRTGLQRNTIEDQRGLNTDEPSRYSSGKGIETTLNAESPWQEGSMRTLKNSNAIQ